MTRDHRRNDHPLAGPCRAQPGELLGLPAGLLAPGPELPVHEAIPAYRAPASPASCALDGSRQATAPGMPPPDNRRWLPRDRFSRLPSGPGETPGDCRCHAA